MIENQELAYPFLQDGDALVLERLRELHDLRPLRVDGERRHDEVGLLLHELADQPRPLLPAGRVVALQHAVLLVEGQEERVREVALPGQLVEEVDAVARAAVHLARLGLVGLRAGRAGRRIGGRRGRRGCPPASAAGAGK